MPQPKKLVIAEKPSVAQDIARALSVPRRGDHFEDDSYVISSAVGHLLELFNPDEETRDRKRAAKAQGKGKWTFASLPALPPRFALRPIKQNMDRLSHLAKLAKRPDLGGVVNACDAGREGELIFHNLAEEFKFTSRSLPVERLWLQSMTPAAIRTAFQGLAPAADKARLRDAAVARSQADWLVGINATRALSALNSKDGGFQLTTAGRVQTPTLALIVARERERQQHVPVPFWLVDAQFHVAAGDYAARWKLSAADGDAPERVTELAQEAADVQAVLDDHRYTGITASDETKEVVERPPALFDLNELQRVANRVNGLPARRTLGAAQALYERYKLLTYPRTESRHLPPDYVRVCEDTLRKLAGGAATGPVAGHLAMREIAPVAATAVPLVKQAGKRVFDAAKVSDHFAIIPTGELPTDKLPEIEQRIYDLVCRRFISTFLPPAKSLRTKRTTRVGLPSGGSADFTTTGKVIIEPGWLAAQRQSRKDPPMPKLTPGQGADAPAEGATHVSGTAELAAKETPPPARHTDASLLRSMQHADKLVEEGELSEALAASGGLGTPATRANIIEELVRTNYAARDRADLVPTAKAFSLMEILEAMQAAELTKPDLTAQWEERLREIEEGSEDPDHFIGDIRKLVERLVAAAKVHDPDATPGEYVVLEAPCLRCGGPVEEGYRRYACKSCGFFFWKTVASRQFTVAEADQLLRDRVIGPFDDFKSRIGAAFTATLELGEDGKVNFKREDDPEIDVATAQQVGLCVKCQAPVLAAETHYICQARLETKGEKCDFRFGRVICSRPIEADEMGVLLDPDPAARRTQLLEDFISKRGKPFKAHLTLDPKGKLGFEFEERKPRKTAAKKTAAKRKPAARKTA